MLSQSLMLLNMLNWILKDAFEDSLIVHSSKQWKCVALPFVRISKSLCCISLLSWFCDCVACRPNHIQDIEAVVVHCCVLVCCMLLCNCVVIVLLYVVVLLLSYCVLLLLSSIVCCLLLESYPRSRNGCRPLFPTNTEGGWAGESMLAYKGKDSSREAFDESLWLNFIVRSFSRLGAFCTKSALLIMGGKLTPFGYLDIHFLSSQPAKF